MQQSTNCELCGYWPQTFATQTAYPVTVTCWAVYDNNYKDRHFHWPVTSSVMMITDFTGAFDYTWHFQYILMTSICQWIWMIFDSLFLLVPDSSSVHFDDTWPFIGTSGDMRFFVSVFSWHLNFCECILMILDSLLVNFDDTGLCQSVLMALDSAWPFYQ